MIVLASLGLALAPAMSSGSPQHSITVEQVNPEVVRPGDPVHLVVRQGAVLLYRRVQALQKARSGERLFVRAQDGAVLSVRYAEVTP